MATIWWRLMELNGELVGFHRQTDPVAEAERALLEEMRERLARHNLQQAHRTLRVPRPPRLAAQLDPPRFRHRQQPADMSGGEAQP